MYVLSRLVGSLDVVREMHQLGKLKDLLEYRPKKITHTVTDKFREAFLKSRTQVYGS